MEGWGFGVLRGWRGGGGSGGSGYGCDDVLGLGVAGKEENEEEWCEKGGERSVVTHAGGGCCVSDEAKGDGLWVSLVKNNERLLKRLQTDNGEGHGRWAAIVYPIVTAASSRRSITYKQVPACSRQELMIASVVVRWRQHAYATIAGSAANACRCHGTNGIERCRPRLLIAWLLSLTSNAGLDRNVIAAGLL